MQFKGAFTALVTPFKNGEVDEDAYRSLIEWQIEQGIDGVVPCGTTGESATLSHEEHGRVIKICVEQAAGRVPVLAGAGSNNTREAVQLTKYARENGADGALLITPYYNKPTPDGVVEHFRTIANEVSMPFIVYNVPGRTSLNLEPKTVKRLFDEIPEVVGIKEASANLKQVSEIVEFCGPEFQVLSGDDFTVLPLLAVGGCGVISVVSNIAPAKMHDMCQAFFDSDMTAAQKLHHELSPLSRGMFIETNPVPAKQSLAWMGKMDFEVRQPLWKLRPESEASLKQLLTDKGLL